MDETNYEKIHMAHENLGVSLLVALGNFYLPMAGNFINYQGKAVKKFWTSVTNNKSNTISIYR